MIVYDERREMAAAQIAALEQRRRTIAEQMEAIRQALEALQFAPAGLEGVLPYLEAFSREEAHAIASRQWLASKGVTLGEARELYVRVEPPAAVLEFLDTWEGYTVRSADPSRYWKGKAFEPLPANEEEKSEIAARARLATNDPKRIGMFQTAQALCDVVNEASISHFVETTPAGFYNRYKHFGPFVEWMETKNARALKAYVFRPREESFFIVSRYLAFDELAQKSEWRTIPAAVPGLSGVEN